MTLLITGALAFLITHLGVSSTPLRGMLVSAVGEGAYLGIYSLLAAGTLGLLIYGYASVPHYDFLWVPGIAALGLAKAVMPVALILVMSGLLSRNPTSVGMDNAVKGELAGIFRIVRHPLQWGILLWSLSHIVANGDVASLVFFGAFALLSAVGMLAIDAKRRHRPEPEWQQFYATTSWFPFVALVTGRTRLRLADINWIAVAAGLVLYVLLFLFHGQIAGVALV